MVYDDDTEIPPHHIVWSADRTTGHISPIPEATRQLITRYATKYPRWEPEQIFDKIRQTRHDVPLDHVYAVLESMGRQIRKI